MTTSSPRRPQFPRQGEWRYEDWLKFPDDGWKYEIIDGVLHLMPLPAIRHQDSSTELAARMRLYATRHRLGKLLAAPCGVKLPGQEVPVEPDILFVKQERRSIIGQQYVDGAPDLIVEILSPSNRQHDTETKFKLYQQSGVAEYWLVDYQAQTVKLYHLVERQYRLQGDYGVGDTVVSTELTGFTIEVATIFDF